MKKLILLTSTVATPALAATGPFFSLGNTNFIVLIAFILFIAVLLKFGVPAKVTGLLDARAAQIKADLDEARALREEAKAILASYERKKKEVQEQATRIVASAKDDAVAAAEQAKVDLANSIARRVAAAEERIASAEADAVRAVREQAVAVAVAAAGDVLAKQVTAEAASASIDAAIKQVGAKMH
ncbi:F0F1 ATP synthase subunit B [Pseudorhodobacter sp. E13]|uniref:F0F1 ATP synthase subunit B n=1 Tax=Pseudorhodobacter sp. E13 TaxID=2487931 RepID=UPI000F8E3611|nr:F0F1 ATP synthase subunit B [Pseudorhodobacter sp. E13]RUS59907.1 F0F1 ATP synthase subunit B [Pseudorhodobacter sp. E13]